MRKIIAALPLLAGCASGLQVQEVGSLHVGGGRHLSRKKGSEEFFCYKPQRACARASW